VHRDGFLFRNRLVVMQSIGHSQDIKTNCDDENFCRKFKVIETFTINQWLNEFGLEKIEKKKQQFNNQ
jgi:hypothetical protein